MYTEQCQKNNNNNISIAPDTSTVSNEVRYYYFSKYWIMKKHRDEQIWWAVGDKAWEICEIFGENLVKGLFVALYLLKGAELAGENWY